MKISKIFLMWGMGPHRSAFKEAWYLRSNLLPNYFRSQTIRCPHEKRRVIQAKRPATNALTRPRTLTQVYRALSPKGKRRASEHIRSLKIRSRTVLRLGRPRETYLDQILRLVTGEKYVELSGEEIARKAREVGVESYCRV